jgi:hypothetical protein
LESCQKWHQTFFYVRNLGPVDFINLLAYVLGALARTTWQFNPRNSHAETNRIVQYLAVLKGDTRLSSDDIVRTFIARRVLPLQRRAHKICQMRGRFDPTRITTFRLCRAEVAAKAKQISNTKMSAEWKWGLEPYSRKNPAPSRVRSGGLWNVENYFLTCLCLVLHNFACISAEEPESYAPRRAYEDDKDPNPYRIRNAHEMGATRTSHSGNTSASFPSRSRAGDSGSDDDCVILEVLYPLHSSYALCYAGFCWLGPLGAGACHTARGQGRGSPGLTSLEGPEAGSSCVPALKRQKILSFGPLKKKKNAITTSSG